MNLRASAIVVISLLLSLGSIQALDEDVTPRGSLDNAFHQFTDQKTGRVAFLGGSITEMPGYRPMVCEGLQKRFPQTEFSFIAAGISSTCSTTGAFRFQSDILANGPIDLLFVEFAVNDDQDANHTRETCIRGMEGIIRHLLTKNPKADVVMTFFVNESSMQKYNAGETPLPILAHTEVAKHYQISTINLARAVTKKISAGEFDWKKFGGVHPAPFGNRIAADMIEGLFEELWIKRAIGAALPHELPQQPLDANSYTKGRFLSPDEVHLGAGWTAGIPDWKSLPGGKRERFTSVPVVEALQPGAGLQIPFEGRAIGAYVVAGPDAGTLEASIDGGQPKKVNLYAAHSKNLHYPRTVMFADELPEGRHTLQLKVSQERDDRSSGHAARVLHFVVNGDAPR